MTEAKWLKCTDPQPMLEFLQGKATARKMRLFACARCRQAWKWLVDERSRTAVEVGELFADGKANNMAMEVAWANAHEAFLGAIPARRLVTTQVRAAGDVQLAVTLDPTPNWGGYFSISKASQCRLIRDIFGSLPFRPFTVDPHWRTSTVMQLAKTIYQERAFDRLPILADALEEAGCSNADLLNHCRHPGEHVRGCWLLDLLLDKE